MFRHSLEKGGDEYDDRDDEADARFQLPRAAVLCTGRKCHPESCSRRAPTMV